MSNAIVTAILDDMPAALSPSVLVRRYLDSRVARAAALLFLLWGAYCLVFGIHTVDAFIPYRIDLDVYRLGAQVFRDGGPLYGTLPDTEIGANLPFTYPPIAAALFLPLTWVPLKVANVVFSAATVVATVLVVRLVLAEVSGLRGARASWVAVALSSVLVWIIPVRETIEFGQVNVFLMALVVVDILLGRGKWWQGSLIGLAMAIKLTPAVFLAYFLVRRDWRALAMGVGSAVFYTGIGFLLTWEDSVLYWSETLTDPTRIGDLSYVSNQSLNGLLHRLFLPETATSLIWFGTCAVLGLSLLVLLRKLFGAGHDAVAMTVMGVYALLASPVSWAHHWVWIVPGLVVVTGLLLRIDGPVRGLLAATAGLGVLVFFSRGIWYVEPRPQGRTDWQWWEHVVGNSYVLWGLLFVATAWGLGTRRSGRGVPETAGQESSNPPSVDG